MLWYVGVLSDTFSVFFCHVERATVDQCIVHKNTRHILVFPRNVPTFDGVVRFVQVEGSRVRKIRGMRVMTRSPTTVPSLLSPNVSPTFVAGCYGHSLLSVQLPVFPVPCFW